MPRRGSVPSIDPIERLDLFEERVEELHRRRLVRDGFSAKIHFSATPDQASMAVTSPDKDDLDAYLTTLRQFVSSDEPVFVDGIFSIAYTHTTDPKVRGTIAELRESWRLVQTDRSFIFRQGDRDLIAKDVFDLYVNARVFHGRDPEAMALLKAIEDPALPPIARAMLNDYIVNVNHIVTWLADLIRAARDEGKISPTPVVPPKRTRKPDAQSDAHTGAQGRTAADR